MFKFGLNQLQQLPVYVCLAHYFLGVEVRSSVSHYTTSSFQYSLIVQILDESSSCFKCEQMLSLVLLFSRPSFSASHVMHFDPDV